MKKSITNYLYALSENDYNILYEIMSLKYRKFIQLYWMLKDFSDNIVGLRYKEKTEKEKLKITVIFSGIDAKDVERQIIKNLSDSDEVKTKATKKEICIEIYREERDA